jgi:hypothetical protein
MVAVCGDVVCVRHVFRSARRGCMAVSGDLGRFGSHVLAGAAVQTAVVDSGVGLRWAGSAVLQAHKQCSILPTCLARHLCLASGSGRRRLGVCG